MANILSQTIEQISKEKGIEPEVIQRALEDAMVAAAKKYFKTGEELQARFDPETGTIDVFAVKEIVEAVTDADTQMSLEEALSIDESFQAGEFVEIPKPTGELGRIAAQTAKQVILQKVREAEREIVFDEFSGQVGQLINGIVRRIEGRDIILDTGKTEALLPGSEQSRNEMYKQGDRVRAVIVKVHRLSKGPQIVVSRTDPSLLVRLFEMEIPEVYDGTVRVRAAVREGGERAKVAVSSRDDAVDPVGACVGMKGTRINAVIRELKGEKIDIIEYSDDVVEYTMNSLNPAKIAKVLIADPVGKLLEVIVPEDQLSLAIGKKGQNVRLASKLLGWQIDIKSEEEKKQEVISQMENLEPEEEEVPLESLNGIGDKTISRLKEAEIFSVQALAASELDTLVAIPGIGQKTAEKLIGQARAFMSGGVTGDLEGADGEEAPGDQQLSETGELAPAGIGEQLPASPEDERPKE
jgi:transcription termination/antitermination protein NusA